MGQKLLYIFEGYALDTDRRELRRGDTAVALQPQVFDLLEYLIRNRDRVVGRDDMLDAVWGGRIVSESTLTSRINAARTAIGDTGEDQRLIRTLPRKGVRFIGAVEEEQRTAGSQGAMDPLKPALALPDRPSIAVLPFVNMSGNSGDEYFGDGIAEDIITMLSRSQSLFVIARNSSFTYRGRAIDVKQIAHELGVRYVLEGSVRRSGNRARITAQLVDAVTGNHLWAERYDRDPIDVFAVQDEIAEAVAIAIEPAVAEMERRRAIRKPPENLGAWEAYQRGLWHMGRIGVTDNEAAMSFFRRAIDLDPSFASARGELALALLQESSFYQVTSLSEALAQALPMAQRAIALDPLNATGYISMGMMRLFQGDREGMLAAAHRALAISPNYAAAHHLLGGTLLFSGRPREALEAIRKAMRLDPHNPFRSIRLSHVSTAHYFLREYEAAVDAAKEALRSYPEHPWAYRWLAAALGQADRLDEAKQALQKAIAISPKSFDMFARRRFPGWRVEEYEHMLEGLRKAGWPG